MVSFGIDVSKDWVDVARTDNSRQCKQQDRIANNKVSLSTYWAAQQARYPGLQATVESTGMYHLAVVRVCLELGVRLYMVNPILTKQLTRASVRKVKTDRYDALRLALLGLGRAGYQVSSEQLMPAKFYLRASSRLAAVGRTLATTSGHYELAGLPPELLQATFAVCRTALDKASTVLRETGTAACDGPTIQLLQTLPGIGPVTASRIVAEVGTVGRFSSARQLIAYAGLDPTIRRSGSALNATGKLTKRGSPHLRHALFIAAASARRYDPELRAIYNRKRAEGKSYKQAVVHIARLLVNRIYAVWTRGTAYEKRGA